MFDKMTLRCIVLVTQATPLHVFAKLRLVQLVKEVQFYFKTMTIDE